VERRGGSGLSEAQPPAGVGEGRCSRYEGSGERYGRAECRYTALPRPESRPDFPKSGLRTGTPEIPNAGPAADLCASAQMTRSWHFLPGRACTPWRWCRLSAWADSARACPAHRAREPAAPRAKARTQSRLQSHPTATRQERVLSEPVCCRAVWDGVAMWGRIRAAGPRGGSSTQT
jgi:hypothetical protein